MDQPKIELFERYMATFAGRVSQPDPDRPVPSLADYTTTSTPAERKARRRRAVQRSQERFPYDEGSSA